MFNEITSGLILGLSNNIFCLGVCAPVLVPLVLSDEKKPWISLVLFLAGRLFAYLVFALGAGLLGIYTEGRIHPKLFAAFTIVLALWLIGFALGKLNVKVGFCGWLGNSAPARDLPFFAGIVMGLNLCPPFLLGLSNTLRMNSIILPVLFFLGFYIGSSVWLLLLLFAGKLKERKDVRVIGQLTALLVGIYYFGVGIMGLIR